MYPNREQSLHQIITGIVPCKILDDTLYIKTPTPEHKFKAYQLYADILYESELNGVLTDKEMQDYMIVNNLWSEAEEKEITEASVKMDGMKEDMYLKYAAFQSGKSKKIKKILEKFRLHIGELFKKKHTYDLYTCSGLASIYQLQYLISNNIIDDNNKPIDMSILDDFYIKQLCKQYSYGRINDSEIRQICKIDSWRSIWNSAKSSSSIFGVSAIELSDEQRSLVAWSRLYDNLQEAAEPPDKEVIDDDDLLDGWLIFQHKKRSTDQQNNNSSIQNLHPGAQEVFIMAETEDDARRINSVNDLGSQMVKNQRLNTIKQLGRVEEQNMPDSRQQIMMTAAEMFAQSARG
jgi:hypothetical protein